MDAATREELVTLRRRAYGLDADIDSDPAALARLRELESREDRHLSPAQAARAEEAERLFGPRWPSAALPPAGGTVDAPATRAVTPAPAPEAIERLTDAEISASVPRTPPPISRAILVGWAASVVVVALVVGGLVFGLASLRPVSTDVGARQVAALQTPASGVEFDENSAFLRQATTLYRFDGLVIAVLEKGILDPDRLCILVAPEQSLRAQDGVWFASGCAAGVFRASATLAVAQDSPPELRDTFPVGTALQFVWDGTAVGVFAADPPPPTNAPA